MISIYQSLSLSILIISKKELAHNFDDHEESVRNWTLSLAAFADKVTDVLELFLHEKVDKDHVDNLVRYELLRKF